MILNWQQQRLAITKIGVCRRKRGRMGCSRGTFPFQGSRHARKVPARLKSREAEPGSPTTIRNKAEGLSRAPDRCDRRFTKSDPSKRMSG